MKINNNEELNTIYTNMSESGKSITFPAYMTKRRFIRSVNKSLNKAILSIAANGCNNIDIIINTNHKKGFWCLHAIGGNLQLPCKDRYCDMIEHTIGQYNGCKLYASTYLPDDVLMLIFSNKGYTYLINIV